MAESVERRQGQNRRQGPIRSGRDRRDPALPISPASTRSGADRRKRDRRSGQDRRKPS